MGAIGGLRLRAVRGAAAPAFVIAVGRAADRHGLDVPLNRAILALLEGLDGAA